MKHLDLFSGIAGFAYAARNVGWETVGFCEIDPYCQKVIGKNFPRIPLNEDITSFKPPKDVDLVTAGFPCQDISLAGDGAGLSGDRSGLFWYILRTIRLVGRPRLLLENVAALLSRGMGVVLGALAQIGYDTEWHCIPASAVGAPHRRDRVWIYGYPKGLYSDGRSTDRKNSESEVPESGNASSPAYAADNGCERIQRIFPEEVQRQPSFSWCEDVRGLEELRERRDIPEPIVCGNGDGLSNRLYALGNAIVPQVAQVIFEAINQVEKENERI